jgi:hypothetical protein
MSKRVGRATLSPDPQEHMLRSATLTAMLSAAVLALLASLPGGAQAAVTCDRVAAATGSDLAAGTAAAPFRTVQKMTSVLTRGQTGCVRGTVGGDVWIKPSGVTLTSEPGQRGRILGQLVIDPDAHEVTVSELDLNAAGLGRPSPIVLGDDAQIIGNDITNDRTPILCMSIGAKGHDSGARADRTLVQGNRIHDCGTSDNHRHGLYVEHAADTHIVGNFIYGNADRGIQLYPDAQRTLIEGNVIDGNGQGIIFGGAGGVASNDTIVRYNVLSNPTLRASIESWYPAGNPVGQNNVVEQNCISGTRRIEGSVGFTARDNLVVDPQYANRAAGDYTVPAGNPCAQLLAAGRAGIQIPKVVLPDPAPAPTPPPVTVPKPTTTPGVAAKPSKPPVRPRPATAGADAETTTSARPVTARPATFRSLPKVRVAASTKRGTRVAVKLSLLKGATGSVKVLVEGRWQGRSWRVLRTVKVSAGRTTSLRLKVPRTARKVRFRATAVEAAANVTRRVPLRDGRATRGA